MQIMKKIVIATVILILLVACGNTVVESPNQINNQTWNSNTFNLLNDSIDDDGGFSNFLYERKYSMKNTRFILELMQKYNYDFPKKNELIETLTKMQTDSTDKINGQQDLIELNSIVHIMQLVKYKPADEFIRHTKELLYKYRKENGLYSITESNDIFASLVTTEYCVDTLFNLGIKLNDDVLQKSLNDILEDSKWKEKTNYPHTIYQSIEQIQLENKGDGDSYFHTSKGQLLKNELIKEVQGMFLSTPQSTVQLIDYNAGNELLKKWDQPIQLNERMINFLNSIRLKDGGFNYLSNFHSDPEDTFQLESMFDDMNFDFMSYVSSIKKYQNQSGLFTFIETPNSNVISTYQALNIYKSLQHKPPSVVKNYLVSIDIQKLSQPELYYYIKACESLEVIPKPGMFIENQWKDVKNKEGLYYILNFVRNKKIDETNKNNIKQFMETLRHEDGGFGFSTSDVSETFLVLEIADNLQSLNTFDTSSIEKWLMNIQNKEGVFWNKDSPDLIMTDYAFKILKKINSKPRHLDKIPLYLDPLKKENGGFSYIKNGDPSLSATYFGLDLSELTK